MRSCGVVDWFGEQSALCLLLPDPSTYACRMAAVMAVFSREVSELAKNKKHEKALKRRRKLQSRKKQLRSRENIFLDAVDSYADEYRKLIRSPLVKGMQDRVFEISMEQWGTTTTEEKLELVGLNGYRVVYWDAEYDTDHNWHECIAKGAGFASAVQDSAGKASPVVFVREKAIVSAVDDEALEAEVRAGIVLLVLLHEYGHAEDMLQGINFDYKAEKVDIVAAEVYAHRFACKFAKNRNYRLALQYYLQNIEDWSQQDNYVGIAARRFREEEDFEGLRHFASRVWNEHRGGQSRIAEQRMKRRLKREQS